MKNPKLVIGIVAIAILLIIFLVVLANSKKETTITTSTSVQQAGFLDTMLNLFQKPGSGTASGTDQPNLWCQLFPKSCKPKKITPSGPCYNQTSGHPGCLSDHVGYNCNGELDDYCA